MTPVRGAVIVLRYRVRFHGMGQAWRAELLDIPSVFADGDTPLRAAQLATARRMRKDGRAVREIAVALKIPRSTVHRALTRDP